MFESKARSECMDKHDHVKPIGVIIGETWEAQMLIHESPSGSKEVATASFKA